MHIEDVYFSDTFFSNEKYSNIRLILVLIAKQRWSRTSLDTMNEFLGSALEQKRYVVLTECVIALEK